MKIVIPTYQRVEMFKKKSFKMIQKYHLEEYCVIVVSTEEDYENYKVFNLEVLNSNAKGLTNTYNWITDHFPVGEKIVYLADDVVSFKELKDNKLVIVDDLKQILLDTFKELEEHNLNLGGFYPVPNKLFMGDGATTTDLRFIYDPIACCINQKIHLKPELSKDDFQRTIEYYKRDGGVLRVNRYTFNTIFNAGAGGNQFAKINHQECSDRFYEYYKEFIQRKIKHKDGTTSFVLHKEVKLNLTTQEKLLNELKRINWVSNIARPNVSGIDEIKTKEYNDRGDPRHIGKPCLSYTFGFIRPRRAKLGTLEITRISKQYSYLYELLKEYVKEVAPDFEYTSITANKNIVCEKHTDKYNQKPSLAIGLGEYTGGNLIIKGDVNDIRYKPLIFHGKDEHWNDAFEGERFSLIYYSL